MFTVYGKELCTYCKTSKDVLDKYKLNYQYKDIENVDTFNEMRSKIADATEGAVTPRTVPQIFYGAVYIGGYQDMCDYILDNDLVV